jgi:hypothetical protein
MIDVLSELVVAFPGAANRTRCFTHILNLVVKVILRQFDMPKAKANKAFDVATEALVELAGDIDMEEVLMDENEDDEEDNREEGRVDPCDWMSQDEQEELDLAARPMQLVLVKVSSNSAPTLRMCYSCRI